MAHHHSVLTLVGRWYTRQLATSLHAQSSMLPPTEPVPKPARVRPMPAFGCFALLILAGLAGAFAVGGSFWGWMTTGALLVIGGLALAIYLLRRNTQLPPEGQ